MDAYRGMEIGALDELARRLGDLEREVLDLRAYKNAHIQDRPTPWRTITLINGWTNFDTSTYGPARWRRIGSRIQLSGFLDSESASSNIFCNLGTSNNPPLPTHGTQHAVNCRVGSGNNNVVGTGLWVNTGTQAISIYRHTNMTWVTISVSYPLT